MSRAPLVILFLLHALLPRTATAQIAPEAEAYLAAALDIMERHSVRRDSLLWPSIREAALRDARGAVSPRDTYPAIERTLRRLGDHHSFLMRPEQAKQYEGRGAAENPAPAVGRVGRIGYVRVPAFAGGDRAGIDRYARRLHREIASADSVPVCGWILDLRENGGGNMWPMLAGIGPILGEGVAGRFVGPAGGGTEWSYRAGAAWSGDLPAASAGTDAYVPAAGNRPVAVLTGPRTASSGEAIVVSFRARPRTRSFGRTTAGASTSNGTFRLSDGAWMLLTTAVFADRAGRRYGGPIAPDEPVRDGLGASPTGGGREFAAALGWLSGQPECGG